ncbi:(2Fe-2S)-binding protein [bacterium]|nr:(2Fe-2S)-binding protein [bacterium]
MEEKKDIVICRCEDITLDMIRECIRNGADNLEEIKRTLRCGMGPCQGTTCMPLIRKELARYLGVSIDEIEMPTKRPPLLVTKFETILEGVEGEE